MGREYKTPSHVFYVCTGSSCKKEDSKQIGKSLRKLAKEYGLKGEVEIIKTDCTDRCKLSPVVCLQPENIWQTESSEAKAEMLFRKEILEKINRPERDKQDE
jgi:(2Fe-2S) ferredoxin